ncbi:hypothetical protein COV04_01385 [Candidatus Uhrbacteria bacterium CG10_big_fil_rev_8_21_14_0_10_48_11]|uniref:Uncharacterized protein n=1 Tax=Candidatus Uhrbacteria bacterium CG10_big_fil_rev_8_21_14_0_10_48_11 TaxID=1975037 RepID=A0A2M8LFG1_9BACT|nr:MAG: hypothetical protein COV04_01385 [Candidatus Uhrbacteria bacterium CG10_big_fil_rev_8_21_14_0_10_48_11]
MGKPKGGKDEEVIFRGGFRFGFGSGMRVCTAAPAKGGDCGVAQRDDYNDARGASMEEGSPKLSGIDWRLCQSM